MRTNHCDDGKSTFFTVMLTKDWVHSPNRSLLFSVVVRCVYGDDAKTRSENEPTSDSMKAKTELDCEGCVTTH